MASRPDWVLSTYCVGCPGSHPDRVKNPVADEALLLSHEVAAMFNDLGVLMAVRGHTEEAELFYRRSLEIRQRLTQDPSQDTGETALTRRNLAILPVG